MQAARQPALVLSPVDPSTPELDSKRYETEGLSFAQLAAILRAHLRMAVTVAVTVIVLSAIVVKLLPRTYTATATMIVSFQVSQGGEEIPVFLLGTYLATQIELMRSPEILLPVVDKLGLTRAPEFTAGFRGGDASALRNYVADALDKHLDAEEGRGSQLLYINAYSRYPEEAAKIANTVAEVYSAEERQRLRVPINDRTRDYSEQLTELREKVMTAQQRVTDFRQRTGTAPPSRDSGGQGTDAETQTLVSLEEELLQAQSVRRAAESEMTIAPLGSAAGQGPPQIQALNSEITAKELELSQLSATYGPRHPKVIEAESDLTKARQDLKAERQRYLDSARLIEAQLTRAVEQQQQKILATRRLQDEGEKLELELESAQAVYKQALESFEKTVFNPADKATNVSFVSHATIPVGPSRPNKVKLMMIAALMAVAFGALTPIIYELFFDRRLHCRDDFERSFGIPVLAEFGGNRHRWWRGASNGF